MWMIRSKGMVNSVGLMEGNIVESGWMANRMGKALMSIVMARLRRDCGKMGRKLNRIVDHYIVRYYYSI